MKKMALLLLAMLLLITLTGCSSKPNVAKIKADILEQLGNPESKYYEEYFYCTSVESVEIVRSQSTSTTFEADISVVAEGGTDEFSSEGTFKKNVTAHVKYNKYDGNVWMMDCFTVSCTEKQITVPYTRDAFELSELFQDTVWLYLYNNSPLHDFSILDVVSLDVLDDTEIARIEWVNNLNGIKAHLFTDFVFGISDDYNQWIVLEADTECDSIDYSELVGKKLALHSAYPVLWGEQQIKVGNMYGEIADVSGDRIDITIDGVGYTYTADELPIHSYERLLYCFDYDEPKYPYADGKRYFSDNYSGYHISGSYDSRIFKRVILFPTKSKIYIGFAETISDSDYRIFTLR